MNTGVVFDSGNMTTKEFNWNQPLCEINKLWHTGMPERQGLYLVVFNGDIRIAECNKHIFVVRVYDYVQYTKEVERWCLIKEF